MATIIMIMIAIIYVVLVAWTWQSLGTIEKTKKIIFILIGIAVTYLLTWIIFQISKSGVLYQNQEIQESVKNMLVFVFTGINGIILMPHMAKTTEKVYEGQIEQQYASKRIIMILIIFLICVIFECGYLKDTQEGILQIYSTVKK